MRNESTLLTYLDIAALVQMHHHASSVDESLASIRQEASVLAAIRRGNTEFVELLASTGYDEKTLCLCLAGLSNKKLVSLSTHGDYLVVALTASAERELS